MNEEWSKRASFPVHRQRALPRVLIVSPHFPPINAPDHQRIRMALPYLAELGWDATVLAVDPDYVEGEIDRDLNATIPANTRIIRCGALPAKWMRLLGVGNLAFRAFFSLLIAGNRILSHGVYDLVFFSTTMFPTFILGPIWKRNFGVSYILDYQDPWISDYYQRTKDRPPGGRLKYWFNSLVAGWLEPRVVHSAAKFVVVSEKYIGQLITKYPFLDKAQFAVLPFGAPELDFERLGNISEPVTSRQPDAIEILYVGAAGPFMAIPLRILFGAIARGRQSDPELWRNTSLKFVGTSYAPSMRATKTVEPIAAEFGLQSIVHEETNRLPYFEALRAIRSADGLLIIGSESPAYSPSKVYPYVLARRPTLAILHRESAALAVLNSCGAADVIAFGETGADQGDVDVNLKTFIEKVRAGLVPPTDWNQFEQYSAFAMTQRLAHIFDAVVGHKRRDS